MKNILEESKKEEQTVQGIKYDVGYDILTENIINERKPADFCMSMPSSSMAAGLNNGNFNIKECKVKK